MRCYACHQPVGANARFCSTCGATTVRHEVALYECGGRKAAIRRVSTPVPNPDVRRW